MGGILYDSSAVLRDRDLSALKSAEEKLSCCDDMADNWGSVKYYVSGTPEESEAGLIHLDLVLKASYSLETPIDDTDSVVAAELFWQKFWVYFRPELPIASLPVSYWGSSDDYRIPDSAVHRPLFIPGDDVLSVLASVFKVGKELNTIPNLDSRRHYPSILNDPFHVRKDKHNLSYSISTGFLSTLEGPLTIPKILHRLPDGANQEECPTLALERAVEDACKARNLVVDRSLSLIVYDSERI